MTDTFKEAMSSCVHDWYIQRDTASAMVKCRKCSEMYKLRTCSDVPMCGIPNCQYEAQWGAFHAPTVQYRCSLHYSKMHTALLVQYESLMP